MTLAQILREVAAELDPLPGSDPVAKWSDIAAVLRKIAQRVNHEPPAS